MFAKTEIENRILMLEEGVPAEIREGIARRHPSWEEETVDEHLMEILQNIVRRLRMRTFVWLFAAVCLVAVFAFARHYSDLLPMPTVTLSGIWVVSMIFLIMLWKYRDGATVRKEMRLCSMWTNNVFDQWKTLQRHFTNYGICCGDTIADKAHQLLLKIAQEDLDTEYQCGRVRSFLPEDLPDRVTGSINAGFRDICSRRTFHEVHHLVEQLGLFPKSEEEIFDEAMEALADA